MSYFGTPLYPASLPDQTAVVSIVGNTTLAAGASTYSKNYIVTGAGGYTITLPAIDGTNWPSKTFTIYNNSSALCTVNTNGTDAALLLGSSYTSMSILPGERFIVQNMVTSWVIALESASRTTTAPQFDNTIRTASTAFVKQASGNVAGYNSYSVSTTLTVANVGTVNTIGITGTGTVTLPLTSAVPVGGTVYLRNVGSASITIGTQGSDVIGTGISSVTGMNFAQGDNAIFVSTGAGQWMSVGGTAFSQFSTGFSSQLSAIGYQKLPTGFIMQWGNGLTSSGSASISFPATFPNSCLATIAGGGIGSGAFSFDVSAKSTTGITVLAYVTNTGALAGACNFNWVAIGN